MKTYAFTGDVIKLTQQDYDKWYSQVHWWVEEGDFLSWLTRLDQWMRDNIPEERKGRWYFIASSKLEVLKNKFKKNS